MDRSRLAGVWSLLVRLALVLAGGVLVLASLYLVVAVTPDGLGPEAGQRATVTERVSYWTPEDGDQQTLRPRTERVRSSGDSLELVRELGGVHSPRGDGFSVPLEDGWRLAEEPRAHASFPATPPWREVPETVYVGVPWETGDGPAVGAFDDFHRLREVERDGLTVVKYKAREPSQFLVDGDTVWFRSAERVAFVEPISGTVVDYEDRETLWRAPLEGRLPLGLLSSPRDEREKVWEATVEPTPAGRLSLAEDAEQARSRHLRDVLAVGAPAVVVGEVLMFAGIAARPRRLFP